MRLLFILLSLFACYVLAHRPPASVLLKAATDAPYLASRLYAFASYVGSRQGFIDQHCSPADYSNFVTPPAPGEAWNVWNVPIGQNGSSTFTVTTTGVNNVTGEVIVQQEVIPNLPYVQLVDPNAQVWFNANPLAGQLTIYNESLIWFEFDLGTGPEVVCFINATASFLNQKSVHDTVAYNSAGVKITTHVRIGHNIIPVDVAGALAFGGANDFGGGDYAAMGFYSLSRLIDRRTQLWGFTQPATSAKTPPGPQQCDHNPNFVGGWYDATGADAVTRSFTAPPLAQLVANLVPGACCTNGNCSLGLSNNLPVFNPFKPAFSGRCPSGVPRRPLCSRPRRVSVAA
jgi:hypothetical protein